MWFRCRRTSVADERGASILELTVVMGLLLVLMGALFGYVSTVQRTSVRQEKRSLLADEMRLAMQAITKETRQATAVRSGSSASVLDIDTFIDGVATQVTFTASGENLTRSSGGVTKTLLTRLTTTEIFTYAPGITTATDVTIRLRARPLQYQTDPAVVEMVSQVRLRNRGRY